MKRRDFIKGALAVLIAPTIALNELSKPSGVELLAEGLSPYLCNPSVKWFELQSNPPLFYVNKTIAIIDTVVDV